MADYSKLAKVGAGKTTNVDLQANSLVVGSIKIGSSSPVEITKAIATKLIAVSAAVDSDGTYDSRYTKITDLASTASGKGASLVGVFDTGGFFTGTNVEAVLAELYGMIGSSTPAAIDVTYDNTSSGLTAVNVQAAIDEVEGRVDTIEGKIGQPNGLATLDGGGKVPLSQLPSAIMTYEGVWNATTNSPTLADGVGDTGSLYRVGTAGTQNLGSGAISFSVGDYVIYNGTTWEKSDTTDAVASVNGLTGVVVLTTSNIAEGSNLYFTDERAQDAIGSALTDTATIDFTYNDGANTITADVKTNSLDSSHLKTTTVDGVTITGGNSTPFAVQQAPLQVKDYIAGESFAANTSFAIRYALTGETAGRVYKADKDTTSANNYHGVAIVHSTSAITAGQTIRGTVSGLHTLGSSDTPFSSGDVGKEMFLGSAGAFGTDSVLADSSLEAQYCMGSIASTTQIWVGEKGLRGIA